MYPFPNAGCKLSICTPEPQSYLVDMVNEKDRGRKMTEKFNKYYPNIRWTQILKRPLKEIFFTHRLRK